MVYMDEWVFVFKQKTAYEMRISDWSSDVCSSDLAGGGGHQQVGEDVDQRVGAAPGARKKEVHGDVTPVVLTEPHEGEHRKGGAGLDQLEVAGNRPQPRRNEAAADDTDDGQHQRDDQRASAGHRRPEGDALDDPIEVRSHGWSLSPG